MKTWKFLCLVIFFCFQVLPRVSVLGIGNHSRLNYLSKTQAERFLSRSREAVFPDDFSLKLECELYERPKCNDVRFCEIFFRNTQKEKTLCVDLDKKQYKLDLSKDFDDVKFSTDDFFWKTLVFTPYDLSFIFLGVEECSYLGPAKIVGRPVQQFICKKKLSFGATKVCDVKISIDEKFLIVLQVDFLNDNGKVIRRISIGSFKKINEIWMPKIVEFCDYREHKHAKLEIISVEILEQ